MPLFPSVACLGIGGEPTRDAKTTASIGKRFNIMNKIVQRKCLTDRCAAGCSLQSENEPVDLKLGYYPHSRFQAP
jgi:hypothetical protein